MTSVLSNNSTTAPLNGSAVFFGGWVSTTAFQAIKVSVLADQIGTLIVQHATSASTSNIIYEDTKAVDSDTETFLEAIVKSAFFRVKYENGTTTQTSFKLQTTSGLQYGGTNGGGGVASEVEITNALLAVKDASSVALLEELVSTGISIGAVDISGVTLVDGRLPTYDASSIEQMATQTDRILFDTDIIANTLSDICGNTDLMVTQLEYINGYLDAGISVSVSNFPATQDVSGSVSVSNFPATQDVSGSVSVSNFPTTQDVSGSVSVSNFPALQDVSGSVSVSNFPTTQDISGSVSVSNQITGFATESTLEEVATTAEDISLQLVVPQRSWVEVDFDTQSSLIAQGAGTWRVPLTGEEGWEYVNTTIGGSSLYFYSNTALVAGGLESNITLGSLTTMWFIGNYRLATAVNPNRRFYLTVYTQPQGAGDYQPWYRSSKTYQLPNSAIVSKAADVFYYAGIDISTIYKEYDHTAYELAVSRGPCVDNEIIQFMSLGSDSATPANEFDGIIKHAGFSTASGTNRVVSFTRASREKIAEDNLKSLTVQSGELKVKDASAVALLAEIADGITVEVGEVDISGASFTENKLNVFDASAVALLGEIANGITVQVGQVEISGVVITEISGVPIVEISGNVDCNVSFPSVQVVEVSGVPVVEISGNVDCNVSFPSVQIVEVSGSIVSDLSGGSFTDSKLNVFDASSNEHLFAIEDILDNGFVNVYDASANSVLEKLSFYADPYGAFDLRTQVMNEIGVSVNNTPTVSLSGGTEVGLLAGTQVALASGAQVQLVSSEVSLALGTTVGLSAGSIVDVNNFPAKQSVFVENTAEGFDLNVNITNASLAITSGSALSVTETNPITGFALESSIQDVYSRLHDISGTVAISGIPVVEISGNVVVSDLSVNVLNSFLDVHCFGSSDGTTFHHIKTNPNGVVATNAVMETDANGALTSTSVSGTETYNALHTIVKDSVLVSGISNAVSVQNATATQLAVKAQQYGSYGNLANNVISILPAGVTSGIDVSGWSYVVGYYEDYYAGTPTVGALRLQYSFDNITYYNLFNTQIFPSGTAPRTANINKQDIPGINWIRFKNDTSSTMTSVTITLLGGSLS